MAMEEFHRSTLSKYWHKVFIISTPSGVKTKETVYGLQYMGIGVTVLKVILHFAQVSNIKIRNKFKIHTNQVKLL